MMSDRLEDLLFVTSKVWIVFGTIILMHGVCYLQRQYFDMPACILLLVVCNSDIMLSLSGIPSDKMD